MTLYTAYSALDPELKKEGFCIFAPRLSFFIHDASTFGGINKGIAVPALVKKEMIYKNGKATVTNIVLHDGRKADDSGHIALTYNTRVWALVIKGLSGAKVRELPCNAVKKDTMVDRFK